MGLVGIPKPCHDDLSKQQVTTPARTHQQWNEKSSVEKCTKRHGNTKHDVEVVKHLKHAFAHHGKSGDDDACHGKYEQGATRVDSVEEEKVPKVVGAGSFGMNESNIGMKDTIEICKSGCKLVISECSFKWQTEEKSEE